MPTPQQTQRQAQIDALAGEERNTTQPGSPRRSIQHGDFNRMHGYDANKWNTGMDSVKYTAGRIASRYEPRPSSMDAIFADPDFQTHFPNARRLGKDKIDFGGVLSEFDRGTPVGIVDIGEAFDDTNDSGAAWWWGAEESAPQPNGGLPSNSAPFQSQNQLDVLNPNADESLAALIAQLLQQNERGAVLNALG